MDPAALFANIGALAAAISAMAGSVLLAFWRKPLPFVPIDIRSGGAFYVARLTVGLIIVFLVFGGSSYLAKYWTSVAVVAVFMTGFGFLFTYWLCAAKVYEYRPHPRAAMKRIVGGRLTAEALAINKERDKSVTSLLEECGNKPDRVFEPDSVAANKLLIMIGILITMTGGGIALGTLAAVSASSDQVWQRGSQLSAPLKSAE